MVDVVNVVASGSLGVELDLKAVSVDLGEIAEFDPDKYPGVYIRLSESAPLVTLYRTGKYIITGSSSELEAIETRENLLSMLADNEVLPSGEDESFGVQNYVCVGKLAESINLTALAIGLGLENTEYEPEQFPGMVYRPPDHQPVLLVFSSGKAVVTGAKSVSQAEEAFESLRSEAEMLLSN